MRMRVTVGSLALSLAVMASRGAPAHAQEATGFAVNRFEPAERGSHWFVLESLDLRGNGRPALGVTADYQLRPLAIYEKDGSVRSSPLEHMMTTHIGASLALADRVRFGVNVPLVLYETGDTGTLAGVTYPAPASEQAIGDVRLGVDLRLFGEHDGPITMAVGGQVWLPTGDSASYTGDGRVRVAPRVLAAGIVGAFTYAAKVGVMFRDPEASTFANSPVGHELVYAAAAGARVADGRLVIGPEVFGSTVVTDQTFKTRTTPLEIILGGHYAFAGGARVGLGGGTGLTRGYGSPELRLLGSLEWSPDVIVDTDGDGVPDDQDACPKTPGVRSADPEKNGCPVAPPPPDRDGDGVLDKDDACPDVPGKLTTDPRTSGCADRDGDGILDPLDACVDVAGIPSDDPKKNGCPELDTDHDGILDKEDACPSVAGIRTQDPKTNGCPDPDRDKDGVLNDADACPDEPGKPDPDPKRNGCPKAFVQGTQIKILDQVKFKTGSAEIIGKDSDEVLQAVQKVLVAHPEIKSMRVEGHTDDRGAAALNRKLSKDRAASVVKWLVKNGIEASRLTSEGFGPDRPIDDNKTEKGRQNNRRVEFHIDAPAPATAPTP
jgi:outer membrane protein OmpA-like peptidoglycan-associated protein